MANIRVKDLPNTDTLVDGDELIVDSSSAGTRRISFGELKSETASDFVAAPSTYKVATLAADNKLDPSQIPDTLTNGLNFVGVANSAPDLVSTTQGDFYVIGTAFGVYSVGDQAVYDGSAYVRVTDGTTQIGEGGTGSTTAAGARTNLSVNSKDEDAQANALKVTAPALYFNGSSSFVEVAYDSKHSFTNGSSDQPFSAGGWVKKAASDQVYLLSKRDDVLREYLFQVAANGSIYCELFDSSNNTAYAYTAAGTVEDEEWTHVAFTFSASSAASSAADDFTIYKNGVAQSTTTYNAGGYTGMTDNSKPLWIQKSGSSNFGKGHIRDCKIFNKELTATEIAQLARGNDLGFFDEWGGAHGGVYTQDATPSGEWTGTNLVDSDEAGPIGGRSNILKLTTNSGSSTHYIQDAKISTGKRYRVEGYYYIPSGQSNVDGFRIGTNTSTDLGVSVSTATLDAWTKVSCEFISNSANIRITLSDSGAQTFDDAGGDDVAYFDALTITEIGTLADFRSERYDTSTSKLYDISDNAFVGTGTSVSLTGREQPVYEHGTWTPSISFGGASVGLSASSASGFYTRIGNQCIVRGAINLSAKGSSTGAAKITGLPFTSVGGTSMGSMLLGLTANMSGLTSVPTGQVAGNDTTVDLYDWGATGTSTLNETNFTDTTYLRFSATYQIQ
jgi:hypothetical protein